MITQTEIDEVYEGIENYGRANEDDDLNEQPVCRHCGGADLATIETGSYWQRAVFDKKDDHFELNTDATSWDSSDVGFDTTGVVCCTCYREADRARDLFITAAEYIRSKGGRPRGAPADTIRAGWA